MGYLEDYISWNILFFNHFFNEENSGDQVILFVNSDLLNNIGKDLGGEENFKKTIQGIHKNNTGGICSKTLSSFKDWRKSNYEFPPYISTLAFFVYSSTLKDPVGPRDSYHRKLHFALGDEKLTTTHINNFSKMFNIWKDLDSWTNDDKKGSLGSFTFWGNSSFVHVSVPRFQGLISGTHLTKLPYIFFRAGIMPDLLPSEQELRQALLDYGRTGSSRLPSETITIIENASLNKKRSEEEIEVYHLLIRAIYNQIIKWDGNFQDNVEENSHNPKINGRICLKFGRVKDNVFIRVGSNPALKGKRNYFSYLNIQNQEIIFNCEDSPLQIYFSKRFQYQRDSDEWGDYDFSDNPKIWDGLEFSQNKGKIKVEVQKRSVRIFLPGNWWDTNENWIEANRLERDCKFLLACKNECLDLIENWLKKSCSNYLQKKLKPSPTNWSFFEGENACESLPDYPVLSLSNVTTIKLIGGLKARGIKGKKYLLNYPPSVRIEGSSKDEIVVVKYIDEDAERINRLEQDINKVQIWNFSSVFLKENILGKILSVESGKFLEDGNWEKTSTAHKIEFFLSLPIQNKGETLMRDKFGEIVKSEQYDAENKLINGLLFKVPKGDDND